MWNTSEASKNHPLIQEGQGERPYRGVGMLDVPRLSEPPFPPHPPCKVFISHLHCLAQMVDSAGLFNFFFCKRLFWAMFLSMSSIVPFDFISSSWVRKRVTNGPLKVCLLYLCWKRRQLNKISTSQEDWTGMFLTLKKNSCFYVEIPKNMDKPNIPK